nr:MAG TPA: hypothetical protein [Caudoviricetes sp.]
MLTLGPIGCILETSKRKERKQRLRQAPATLGAVEALHKT